MPRSFMGPARRGVRLVRLLVAFLVLAHVALAEDYRPQFSRDLGRYKGFYLFMDDDTKDGCWPRPTETKLLLENRLRQNGITVGKRGQGKVLGAYVQGYAVNSDSHCVLYVELSIPNADWEGSHFLLYGKKHSAQDQVTQALLDLANMLIADWVHNNQ